MSEEENHIASPLPSLSGLTRQSRDVNAELWIPGLGSLARNDGWRGIVVLLPCHPEFISGSLAYEMLK